MLQVLPCIPGSILGICWVRLSHPIYCPEFSKKYFHQNWLKMAPAQGCKQTNFPFFAYISIFIPRPGSRYYYDQDHEIEIELLAQILKVVVFTQSSSCFRDRRQIALLILRESKRFNEFLFSQNSESHRFSDDFSLNEI